jgi:condensin complex subunit 3
MAGHRKLSVNLATLQRKAARAGVEDWFNSLFAKMIMRVLPLKKGDICADRVVDFVEMFMSHIEQNSGQEQLDENNAESTLESRFAEFNISYLLKGTNSKDKTVRFRACQIIAVAIRQLGEISDEAYDSLKLALCKRVYDKEASVRLQAVLALSRLQGAEEEDDDNVTRLLVSILQHDSNAEVRRAVLYNLTKTSKTIPYLLQRAWDVHATNRRCVYARTLKEIGDFRLLSIGMREQLLAWGLKDRDTTVRSTATKMLVNDWLATANNDLVELLERLDVINSQIARAAMTALFDQRRDILEKLEFPDDLWRNLTAETAFLASCFNAFCVENDLGKLVESQMPELTKLAFLIQEYLGLMEPRNNGK